MQLQLQWWSVLPFAAMLAGIAVLPLVPATAHWWERRSSQLAVALVLGVPVAVWMWLALGWQAVFAAVVEYGQIRRFSDELGREVRVGVSEARNDVRSILPR